MDSQAASSRTEILDLLKPHQTLLAVSKLQPIEKIQDLHSLGQIHFAENYVQEALEKIEKLQKLNLQWHLIGPLQKNKVKFLKKNFSYVHSIDSFELANLVSEKAIAIGHKQTVFLQINLSGEESKTGFDRGQLKNSWLDLQSLDGIKIIGLMTMPPLENAPEKNRKYFAELKTLGATFNLTEFSMGTSQDYKIALEEGATWIRIGTVLFGEREFKKKNNESRTQ